MAKLIVTDGIALFKLSRTERYVLGRHYIAFELDRILKVSVEQTPKRSDLGEKTRYGRLPFNLSGEYQIGVKRSLFIGPKKANCIRVLLLNPSFDELYVTSGDQLGLYDILKGYQTGAGYPKD